MTRRTWILAIALALVAPVHAAPKNFIWKATGKGTVVYLAGSIHMLTPEFYPLPQIYDDAFKDSDLLVEEIDLGEMTGPTSQLMALQKGMLTGGQTLDQVLTPATLALVKKTVEQLGAPLGALQQFKPWMLAIALEGLELQKSGFDPQLGIDMHYYQAAIDRGTPVQGLETADDQISQLDGMTMDQQDRMLATTLKELASETANVTKLTAAWKAGDSASLEKIVLGELKAEPVMYQRLLVQRNRNWIPKLEALFARKGHAIVIVGAAHLVGPDGILATLRAKGYTIEQQ